ncbi:hypothetical protein HN588_11300 [Candidatus Bathyarchaeota archaeon]|jgi:hypothetical protein|nr:hypothetical protein [Candidatus Bathyarchaeota archaeon]
MTDRLQEMFQRRKEFMYALEGNVSELALDMTQRESQRHLRDVSLRGVEEVFEALQHLKNWKPHRKTDIPDFNREEFLEEYVDALNYFFAVLIKAGFSADDLYEMYVHKDQVIHERLQNGY